MTRESPSARLTPGSSAPAFTRTSLVHGDIQVPGKGLVHLQFRRFAGCPICSLHLRTFAERAHEIQAAGVTEVVVFHSSAESLRRYHADLPFAVVPDEDKQLYRQYGLERGLSSMLHPRAMGAAMRGMMTAPFNPLDAQGGLIGLPGDFLIDETGTIVRAHYGKHADDQLEVDDVLNWARGPFA